jgi:hypothetical protein
MATETDEQMAHRLQAEFNSAVTSDVQSNDEYHTLPAPTQADPTNSAGLQLFNSQMQEFGRLHQQQQQQNPANLHAYNAAPVLPAEEEENVQGLLNVIVGGGGGNGQRMDKITLALMLWGVVEVLVSLGVVYLDWDNACDEPLHLWVLLFASRYVFLWPIMYKQRGLDRATRDRFGIRRGIWFTTLMWMIVLQVWVWNAQTCQVTSPTLYTFCLALVVFMYLLCAAPFILVISLWMCIPVMLHLGWAPQGDIGMAAIRRGATEATINESTTSRTFQPSSSTTAGESKSGASATSSEFSLGDNAEGDLEAGMMGETLDTDNQCSICMEGFTEGDILRVLPCSHEFHSACVVHWLKIRKNCPLCRTEITPT